jgi:hypothetical protein
VRVIHRLVGYDRQTDRMKVRFAISEHLMPEAKKIVKVPADDPEAAWSYPLTETKVRRLARLIGAEDALGDAEFYLEAFADPQSAGSPC